MSPNKISLTLTLAWPFSKFCKRPNRRGRNLGSVPSSIHQVMPLHSSAGLERSFEMHPGTLVQFGSTSLRYAGTRENFTSDKLLASNVQVNFGEGSELEELDTRPMSTRPDFPLSVYPSTDLSYSSSPQRQSTSSCSPSFSSPSPSRSTWKTSNPPLCTPSPPPYRPSIDYKAAKLLHRTHSQEQRDLIHRESYTTSLAAQRSHSYSQSSCSSSCDDTQRKTSRSSTSSLSISEYVDILRARSPPTLETDGYFREESEKGRDPVRKLLRTPSPIFTDEREGEAKGWFLVEDNAILDSSARR
jgi:hypothetical protein